VLVIALIFALYMAVVLPLVAIGTCVVCAAGIPVTYLVVLTRVLVSRPAWLPDPKDWPQPPMESDPAVLHYFYGFSCYGLYSPAAADAVHTVRIASDHCRTIWGYSVNAALMSLARRQPQIAPFLRATGAAGMGVGIIIGAFAAACCAFIHMLIVGLCTAWWRFLATVLNGAASAVSRTQTCPSCSAQVDRPRYTCTGRGCQRTSRATARPVRRPTAPLPLRYVDQDSAAFRLTARHGGLPSVRPLPCPGFLGNHEHSPAVPRRHGRGQESADAWHDRAAEGMGHRRAALRGTGWFRRPRGSRFLSGPRSAVTPLA